MRGVDDPAGLPLQALIITVIFFVLTPVTNSFIRTQEYEADIFGLNAARQPDGMALLSNPYLRVHALEGGGRRARHAQKMSVCVYFSVRVRASENGSGGLPSTSRSTFSPSFHTNQRSWPSRKL